MSAATAQAVEEKRQRPNRARAHRRLGRARPGAESVAALEPLQFQSVRTRADSRLWNELINGIITWVIALERAQMRYLVGAGWRLLAALGFGACAWHSSPATVHCWDDGQRRRGLPRIVNNARFLILPWVTPVACLTDFIGAIPPLLAD